MKQRKEKIDNFGEVYVLSIRCTNCDGAKFIGNSLKYECQLCNKDGYIEVVKYDAFKAAIKKITL